MSNVLPRFCSVRSVEYLFGILNIAQLSYILNVNVKMRSKKVTVIYMHSSVLQTPNSVVRTLSDTECQHSTSCYKDISHVIFAFVIFCDIECSGSGYTLLPSTREVNNHECNLCYVYHITHNHVRSCCLQHGFCPVPMHFFCRHITQRYVVSIFSNRHFCQVCIHHWGSW